MAVNIPIWPGSGSFSSGCHYSQMGTDYSLQFKSKKTLHTVLYDCKLKKFFEYVESGEGSIDINNDPINGFWEEIDWDYKRLP